MSRGKFAFLLYPQTFPQKNVKFYTKLPRKMCNLRQKLPGKSCLIPKYHQSLTNAPRAVHTTSALRGLGGSVSHNRNLKSKLTLLSVAWLYEVCRGLVERVAVNGGYCRKNNYKFMKIRDRKQNFVRYSNKNLKKKFIFAL